MGEQWQEIDVHHALRDQSVPFMVHMAEVQKHLSACWPPIKGIGNIIIFNTLSGKFFCHLLQARLAVLKSELQSWCSLQGVFQDHLFIRGKRRA